MKMLKGTQSGTATSPPSSRASSQRTLSSLGIQGGCELLPTSRLFLSSFSGLAQFPVLHLFFLPKPVPGDLIEMHFLQMDVPLPLLSRFCIVRLFATPWTVGHQASLCRGFFQARILEWVAISSSKGSSLPGIRFASPMAPALAGRFFTTEPPGKPIRCITTLQSRYYYPYFMDMIQLYQI